MCSKTLLIINVMKMSKPPNKNFKKMPQEELQNSQKNLFYRLYTAQSGLSKKKSESQTHFANIYQILSCLYLSCPHSRNCSNVYSSSQKKYIRLSNVKRKFIATVSKENALETIVHGKDFQKINFNSLISFILCVRWETFT